MPQFTTTTDFFTNVYDIVKLIPRGRVSTYGAIAKALGSGKSSRLVGNAMNHSHSIQPLIPAHRVVNRNGLLTGKHHFAGETTMEDLLASEGIMVDGDVVKNFEIVFWDPMTEL